MSKTNLQSFKDSLKKACEEDMKVIKSGVEEEPEFQAYIVLNKDNAYIVKVDEEENVVYCNCPNSYWKGRYHNSPIICKHMMKVALEHNLNITQLGGLCINKEHDSGEVDNCL